MKDHSITPKVDDNEKCWSIKNCDEILECFYTDTLCDVLSQKSIKLAKKKDLDSLVESYIIPLEKVESFKKLYIK